MIGLDRLIVGGLHLERPFGVGLNSSFESAVKTPVSFADYLPPESLRTTEELYSKGNAQERADAFTKLIRHDAFLSGPKQG